jgi:acyl dehydratase
MTGGAAGGREATTVFAVGPSDVGRPVRDEVEPHVRVATRDSIRQFARAYGDDNPLYSDPGHAARSARGRLVAPPLFPIATGVPDAAGDDPLELDAAAAGTRQTIVCDRWTLCRPIDEGTELTRRRWLHAVETDGAGRQTVLTVRTAFDANGVTYAVHDRVRRYEAGVPQDSGDARDRARYTSGALAAIDAAYAAAVRRGTATRAVREVHVDERLPRMVKGPLTVTDLVTYRAGVGPGPLGGEPLGLAYLNRQRRPRLYALDDSGVPDIVERRHYDVAFARSLGYPAAYDYSHTRLVWLSHLVTDWIGDGGWLWSLSGRTLANNYVGDTHWLDGIVTAVRVDGGVGTVTLRLEARNQDGDVTCDGEAIVLLPLDGQGHVADAALAERSGTLAAGGAPTGSVGADRSAACHDPLVEPSPVPAPHR